MEDGAVVSETVQGLATDIAALREKAVSDEQNKHLNFQFGKCMVNLPACRSLFDPSMLLLLQPSLQGAASGAVPLLLNGSIIPDVAEPEVGVQHRLMGQQAQSVLQTSSSSCDNYAVAPCLHP